MRSGRRPRGGPSAIHAGLVGDRALIGTPYLGDARLRAEYEREIAPRTEAALGKLFAELPQLAVRRALDLGAGTGAARRAIHTRFGADVTVVGVDRVAGAAVDVVADLRRAGRPTGVAGRFDLVTAAHVLNELGLDVTAKARLVRSWCDDLLEPGGMLVLLEPALRETSRALLELRDALVSAPERQLTIVAPCLRSGACPALDRPRDWCHDTAVVRDETSGARWRVDFSYLVLTPRASDAPHVAADRVFRIVSDPMVEKGRLRVFACGEDGRHAFVRQDRDESAANAAFGRMSRGDLVRIGATRTAGDGLRVGADTVIEPVAPPRR